MMSIMNKSWLKYKYNITYIYIPNKFFKDIKYNVKRIIFSLFLFLSPSSTNNNLIFLLVKKRVAINCCLILFLMGDTVDFEQSHLFLGVSPFQFIPLTRIDIRRNEITPNLTCLSRLNSTYIAYFHIHRMTLRWNLQIFRVRPAKTWRVHMSCKYVQFVSTAGQIALYFTCWMCRTWPQFGWLGGQNQSSP